MCKIMCYTRHSSFLICQQERLQRTFCVSCFTVDALGLTCPSRLTCPSECSSWLWFFYWLLLQRKRQNNLKAFWGLHNWKKQMILRTWTLEVSYVYMVPKKCIHVWKKKKLLCSVYTDNKRWVKSNISHIWFLHL